MPKRTLPADVARNSGAPVDCALEKDQDPLEEGYVFAVHSHGCKDKSKRCTPEGPSYGTDVRVVAKWISDIVNEKKTIQLSELEQR